MSQQAAVLTEKGKKFEIRSIEKHVPNKGEILLKAHTVSTNPGDGVIQNTGLLVEKYPVVMGFDVAGVVEEVGEGVTRFKKGDKVIAMTWGMPFNMRNGAFQEYPVAKEEDSGVMPSNLNFDQAVTLISPTLTAASGFFINLRLPRLNSTKKPTITKDSEVLFVNSGSSAVGAAAVQLAALMGYRVIATSSPKNFDLVKSLGASDMFDYRDPDLVKKVQEAAGKKINLAFDAASSEESINQCVDILNGSGNLCQVKPHITDTERKGVSLSAAMCFAINKDKEMSAWWWSYLKSAVEAGSFVGLPYEALGHGLGDIQKVLDHHASGKVSATKPIIKLI